MRSRIMGLFRFLRGLALMLSAAVPLHAQAESPLTELVGALVAHYDSAWNHRDTSTVGRLLAPRYQYFSSRGEVSSRAAIELAHAANRPGGTESRAGGGLL